MNSYRSNEPTRRLYRNRETGIIMGVCSGLAEFFDFEVWVVRVLAVVSLLFFTIITAVVYIMLAFLLRDRPLSYQGREKESRFWREHSSSSGGPNH